MREALDAEDQPDRGDDVHEIDDVLRESERHRSAESGASASVSFLRLNMSSMRSVTRKPPTMLIVPKTTAMNASVCSSVESADPRMSIPPTRTMPWIAFVPDMSGVCRSVGTREMSSIPRKIETTRIVIEAISSELMGRPLAYSRGEGEWG